MHAQNFQFKIPTKRKSPHGSGRDFWTTNLKTAVEINSHMIALLTVLMKSVGRGSWSNRSCSTAARTSWVNTAFSWKHRLVAAGGGGGGGGGQRREEGGKGRGNEGKGRGKEGKGRGKGRGKQKKEREGRRERRERRGWR